MKKILSAIAILFIASFVHAQTPFEGSIKWSMSVNAAGQKAGTTELTPKQQSELKEGITQLEKQLNDPDMKAVFDANPSMKATLESQLQVMKSMQGAGGTSNLFPKGYTIRMKNGSSLTTIDGGMANMTGDMLYIRSTDKTYSIKHADKTYSIIPSVSKTGTTQPVVTVTPTTETKNILTYTCTKYNVTTTQNHVTHTMQIWATKDLKQFDSKSFQSGGISEDHTSEAFKKIDGVPMRIEGSQNGHTIIMEVTEITPAKLADSVFVIPAGYKEVPYIK